MLLQIRVFGKKTAVEAGLIDYAFEIAPKILEFFEDYFQIPEAIPPKIGNPKVLAHTFFFSSTLRMLWLFNLRFDSFPGLLR